MQFWFADAMFLGHNNPWIDSAVSCIPIKLNQTLYESLHRTELKKVAKVIH